MRVLGEGVTLSMCDLILPDAGPGDHRRGLKRGERKELVTGR